MVVGVHHWGGTALALALLLAAPPAAAESADRAKPSPAAQKSAATLSDADIRDRLRRGDGATLLNDPELTFVPGSDAELFVALIALSSKDQLSDRARYSYYRRAARIAERNLSEHPAQVDWAEAIATVRDKMANMAVQYDRVENVLRSWRASNAAQVATIANAGDARLIKMAKRQAKLLEWGRYTSETQPDPAGLSELVALLSERVAARPDWKHGAAALVDLRLSMTLDRIDDGAFDEAIETAQAAVAITLAQSEDNAAEWRPVRAYSAEYLGLAHQARGDHAEALKSFEIARDVYLRLVQEREDYALEFAEFRVSLARSRFALNDNKGARWAAIFALMTAVQSVADDPERIYAHQVRLQAAVLHLELGFDENRSQVLEMAEESAAYLSKRDALQKTDQAARKKLESFSASVVTAGSAPG